MPLLLKNIKHIENQIDDFLDAVSQGAVVFKDGVRYYLDGEMDKFNQEIESIVKLENRADDLRRDIENELYTHSLIPEHRGDVLGLLENIDNVIDTAKKTLDHFAIETPKIHPELRDGFLELSDKATQAVEAIVMSVRAFFKDVHAVKNYLHKVFFYEKEADRTASRLKRHIFSLDIDLAQKLHLRYFAISVDSLADSAQVVADRLTIYTIKRIV